MLKLLLPVIFPSWRFFSSIGASPRVEFAFLDNQNNVLNENIAWQEFRPRPKQLSFFQSFFRLFHNPRWNESLFVNTCAERLFEGASQQREHEIMRRILAAISNGELTVPVDKRYVVYRILAVIREGQEIKRPITFIATPVLFKGCL